MYITASKLYDYIQCPHRPWRDIWGPQEEKIKETNPFVKLLWEKGVKHEEKIISRFGDFLDLKDGLLDERFQRTIGAMKSKTSLIYQGVLKYENLLGIPDILKKLPDDTYIPIDIKSGAAGIIYTDISRDGMLTGPNIKVMQEMVDNVRIPVIASGGVSSIEDIKNLKQIKNLWGVIVGKAIYSGAVYLKEAIKIVED